MEQSITRVSAMRSAVWTYVLLSAGLCGVACRKAAPPPPQPPPPTPIVVPRKEPPKKDVNLPAAPPIATKAPEGKPPVSSNPPVLKPPAAKPQRRPRVARKAAEVKPPAAKPVPVEEAKTAAATPEPKPEAPASQTQPAAAQPEPTTAATPPSAAAPKLGQMLKPEESREYNKRLDTTVDRVKAAVAAIQTKPLTDDQKEIVGRIRSFLAQAEQAREPDVISAVNLAERADLLSRDLLERLR